MSPLTLYSFRRCPFAIRVRMVLEEKGISYQLREEDLSSPSSELLAMHPEGRVPLLVHQVGECQNVIYQSTVITEYLDEEFPGPQLMPTLPLLRAQVRLWTYWCDYLFKPDLDLFKYEFSRLELEKQKELIERLEGHFQKWDQALRQTPYLIGDEMTLADIHLFPFARQFMAIKPAFPNIQQYLSLQNWLDQMISRPTFSRVMKKDV